MRAVFEALARGCSDNKRVGDAAVVSLSKYLGARELGWAAMAGGEEVEKLKPLLRGIIDGHVDMTAIQIIKDRYNFAEREKAEAERVEKAAREAARETAGEDDEVWIGAVALRGGVLRGGTATERATVRADLVAAGVPIQPAELEDSNEEERGKEREEEGDGEGEEGDGEGEAPMET